MKQKPPIDVNEAEKVLGAVTIEALQDRYDFLKEWILHCPLDMKDGVPIIKIRHPDLERSFQMLAVYGVSRERARYVSNGIDILGTRFNREIDAIIQSPCYAIRLFIKGEISAGKLGEQLGLRPEEISDFKKACKVYD